MQADHAVRAGIAYHLVKAALLASGQHIFHRAEIGCIDLDRAQPLARLPLGHPDAGKRGMTE